MNKSTKIPISAFILIGGQSKRFGYPKWKSKVGEITLLNHIYNMCSLFDNIFIVGKEKPEGFNKPFIKDKFDFQAPINGIFTALKITKSDWNFVISIDLPLMKSSIIKEIWELGNKSKNAIIPRVDGYLQPICSFYHKRILSQILNQIESNELSLNGLISSVETNYIDMDNYKKEFLNMNTQKEYNKIIDSIIEE
ncbi:MAG: hypothetical protein CMG45_00665 [Candidatus Marinimicrobia bacterium]|nr:hypothetical protein [Candidatus Neomarinimicrobiota bacterium]|tara:strand:+ start:91 stop:675 length:585 start_codon:yes stop_codon:yes gene_type:complete